MVPPTPSPTPASAKVSCQEANKLEQKLIFYDFPTFLLKNSFVRYCLMSKGVVRETIVAVFPRGSKKRKSNINDKHDHGQRKRKSPTLCWGKKRIHLNENNHNIVNIRKSGKTWLDNNSKYFHSICNYNINHLLTSMFRRVVSTNGFYKSSLHNLLFISYIDW